MSALAFEPVELAAPLEDPPRAGRERLRLISTPLPRFLGPSLPQELLDAWDRALAAADAALFAVESMKVLTPNELRKARHRLRKERNWVELQVAL